MKLRFKQLIAGFIVLTMLLSLLPISAVAAMGDTLGVTQVSDIDADYRNGSLVQCSWNRWIGG